MNGSGNLRARGLAMNFSVSGPGLLIYAPEPWPGL